MSRERWDENQVRFALQSGLEQTSVSEDVEFVMRIVTPILAERDRLRAFVQDIADHGLRADLNPTAPMHDTGQLYDHLVNYLRRCDTGIREQARRALTAADPTEEDK